MKNRTPLWKNETVWSIALLTIVSIISYLPYVTHLGFYRDDWYVLWSGATRGASSLIQMFSIDRPFMGVVYSATYSLFQDHALAWNLFAFGLRLAGALALLWLLRQIWPQQRLSTTLMALLFVVYPGFLQGPNANTFSNHFITYSLAILSIALTIAAIRSQKMAVKILLTVLAMILAVGYFLIYEYMIGLEGLRLLLIGYLALIGTTDSLKKKIWLTVKRWLPYLAAILGYLYWRIFLYHSTRPTTDMGRVLSEYASSPIYKLATLVVETARDFFETTFVAWFEPLYKLVSSAEYKELAASVGLALLAILLIVFYAFRIRLEQNPVEAKEGSETAQQERRFARDWMILGALTILATLLPMVAAGRNVVFDAGFDRYTLQTTIGVAMFLVGAFVYLSRWEVRVAPVLLLVAIGIVTLFHNANDWATFEKYQRNLWWQLSWRVPDIKSGTVLVAEMPYNFMEGYEVWGPANLIYNPDNPKVEISAEVLNLGTSLKVSREEDEMGAVRLVEFERNYANTLVLSYTSFGSCVHVLDSTYLEIPEDASALVRSVALYSQIDQVDTESTATVNVEGLFGPEPEHGWCYYYEKADLARQRGDWEEVVRLGDEAIFQLGMKPDDRSEYMPFLEGYVRQGRTEEADRLAILIKDKTEVWESYCNAFRGLSLVPAQNVDPAVIETLCIWE